MTIFAYSSMFVWKDLISSDIFLILDLCFLSDLLGRMLAPFKLCWDESNIWLLVSIRIIFFPLFICSIKGISLMYSSLCNATYLYFYLHILQDMHFCMMHIQLYLSQPLEFWAGKCNIYAIISLRIIVRDKTLRIRFNYCHLLVIPTMFLCSCSWVQLMDGKR